MDLHELDSANKFLDSQRAFIFSPRVYSALEGGYGSGKTRALCMKAIILCAAIPGNVGLIGRFNATDLEDSTMKEFWDACPPSWIKHYAKARKIVTFRNGSQILFRHLSDPNPKKVHIRSLNLGFFAIDQAEEVPESVWNELTGRLRLARVPRRFGFLAANPQGKDWIFQRFFQPAFNSPLALNPFANAYDHGNYFGVAVKSEENKKSNGGFVDDDVFERWRNEWPAEMVARFLDCSFADFSGKIYKEYGLDTIHNIESFPVPSHWETLVTIDVGGDAPWSVGIWRIDERGDMIRTSEFYKPTVNTMEVANYIKSHSNWSSPNFTAVIDPENKLAMLELSEYGIYCRPARKGRNSVKPGILKTAGYFHVNPVLTLPQWYLDTQPADRIARFKDRGAPRIFAFSKLCPNWCREHDNYHWDDKHPGQPKKEDDHSCDETRYGCDLRPQPSELKQAEPAKLTALKAIQPAAYDEWKAFDERMKRRQAMKSGMGNWAELGADSTEGRNNMQPLDTRYDWSE